MPDAIHNVSSEEKRRLRRFAGAIIRSLINGDCILDGAQTLADYRQRFGQSTDHFLRFGLSELFLSDLLSMCCRHQRKQVSYLLDEHMTEWGQPEQERLLRQQELAMYRKFKDRQGEAKCIRILKALNKR